MRACTFFGHRDCPLAIRPQLREAITEMIQKNHVGMFYVGNHGAFDAMARSILKEIIQEYPYVRYCVVLSRMPGRRAEADIKDDSDSILPDGIEAVPGRFSIIWRNKWMLSKSDCVIAYVNRSWGGAAGMLELAERQKKTILRIRE